jgi:hypothetical protein
METDIPLVLAFLDLWPSGNGASIVPVSVRSAGALEALRNTGAICRRIGESAGHTLETPGSTCDLIIHAHGGVAGGGIDTTRPILDRHD